MSITTNAILKSLRDLSTVSDKIVEEEGCMPPGVSEWLDVIKSTADKIVENECKTQLPSLMTVLKGESQRGPRASIFLTEIHQRLHLHPREGMKASIIAGKRKSSMKTPLRRTRSAKKSTNETYMLSGKAAKLKLQPVPPSMIERLEDAPLSTPKKTVNGKGPTSSKMDKSYKRKSSSEPLTVGEKNKKHKMGDDQLNDPLDQDEQMELMKAKNSNYANKIKSGAVNLPIVKKVHALRNHLETKQDKAAENRKKLMALRQEKLEQNKRTREAKLSKLRSEGQEKTLTNKERTPKALHKLVAEAENETVRETSLSKNSVLKDKQKKQTSAKKLKEKNKTINTSVFKSSEKSPVKKYQKREQDRGMNTTYISSHNGEQPSTNNTVKSLKEANTGTNSGAMKDISNDIKTQKKQNLAKDTKTVKPLIEQQKKLINSATNGASMPSKKASESYAITPTRSSFVSYDISEIRSDSEDEEQQESNSKAIPSWATGVRLRNALLQQHHNPIDTDELFGNVVDLPDLAVIMGVKKKHYSKRTSSAVWNSSFS